MLYVGWVFNWSQPDFKGFRRVIRFPPSTNLRLLGLSNMKWNAWNECRNVMRYLNIFSNLSRLRSLVVNFFSKLHKQHNYETLHKHLDSRSTERETQEKSKHYISIQLHKALELSHFKCFIFFQSNGWWFESPGIVQFKGKFKWSPSSSVRLLHIMLAFFVAFLVKLLPYEALELQDYIETLPMLQYNKD